MIKRRTILAAGAAGLAAGAFWWPRRWRYIVVHHSGGASGDLALLKEVHRQRQAQDPVDMVAYHFVIGNGRGMEMGEIAETERWQKSFWGAHVAQIDRNLRGIGICLIGNFETAEVPEAQYHALVELVRRLKAKHRIGDERVTLHGKTPGEETLCPGRHFPRERFFADITRRA